MLVKKIKKFGKAWFICPHCEKKQESIIRWEICPVPFEYDFKSEKWEMKDVETGDVDDWACPECDGVLDIPKKMLKEIF